MPADLQIQRSVEVPRVIMNLPQGSGMDDDGQRRAASPSLNGFANRRGNDKLRTAHKNSTGNIALQATDGETIAEPPHPKYSRRINADQMTRIPRSHLMLLRPVFDGDVRDG